MATNNVRYCRLQKNHERVAKLTVIEIFKTDSSRLPRYSFSTYKMPSMKKLLLAPISVILASHDEAMQQIHDLSSDDEEQHPETENSKGENSETLEIEDYQEIIDVSSPAGIESSLHDAIYSAPIHRLQQLLVTLVDSKAGAKIEATKMLLTPIATGGK